MATFFRCLRWKIDEERRRDKEAWRKFLAVATAVRNWAGFGLKRSRQTDLQYLYDKMIEGAPDKGTVLMQKAPETREELAEAFRRGRRRAKARARRRAAQKDYADRN